MNVAHTATDEDLYARLRAGQAAALDELFRRYYTDLVRLALRFVGQPPAAEDIVQEVFVGLWDKRATLSPLQGAVGPYLRTAVRNRSLNYLRDQKRLPQGEDEIPDVPDSAVSGPAAALEQDELKHRIDRAVASLPDRCRTIFTMHRFGEMSHREIADHLSISTKTVENQMTRAYRFLRQWLALVFVLVTGLW